MYEVSMLNLPPEYTSENSSEEHKEVFERYKEVLSGISIRCRGGIFDTKGNILWQEDEESYKIRLEKIQHEDYNHFISCTKPSCVQCQRYASRTYAELREFHQENLENT